MVWHGAVNDGGRGFEGRGEMTVGGRRVYEGVKTKEDVGRMWEGLLECAGD